MDFYNDYIFIRNHDILPLLKNKMTNRGKAIGFESKGQTAWIGDRYKLYSSVKARSEPQLFDLKTDPSEKKNLAKLEIEQIKEKMDMKKC